MALGIKLKCPKHPRYNPAIGGENEIRGACGFCYALLALWKSAWNLGIELNSYQKPNKEKIQ
jgi:hypothetical protein